MFSLRASAHFDVPVPTRTSASLPPSSVAIATSPLPRVRVDDPSWQVCHYEAIFLSVVPYLCVPCFVVRCLSNLLSLKSELAVSRVYHRLVVLQTISKNVTHCEVVCRYYLQDFRAECTEWHIATHSNLSNLINCLLEICADIANILLNFCCSSHYISTDD